MSKLVTLRLTPLQLAIVEEALALALYPKDESEIKGRLWVAGDQAWNKVSKANK